MSTFVFNFSPVFVDKVEAGVKRQTVRRHRKDGRVPRAGDVVKCFSGLRTRNTRLLYESIVTDCFPITIDFGIVRPITANGIRLHSGEADAFARLDGFPGALAMVDWFREMHGDNFDGWCVQWRTA